MFKFSLVLMLTFAACAAVFAQDGKTAAAPPNYSESVAYAPRKFTDAKPGKSKKESKKKDEKTAETPVAATETSAPGKTIIVPVAVFDRKGIPVTNLKRADFQIFVDGREKEISAFAAQSLPRSIFLILDMSASTAFQADAMQHLAREFVAGLQPQDYVQILQFSGGVKALTEMTADRQIIEKGISNLKFGDGTSLYDTMSFMLKKISALNSPSRRSIVIVTDGVDTTSRNSTYQSSLIEAERAGIAVFPLYLNTFDDIANKNNSSSLFPAILRNAALRNGIIIGGSQNTESLETEYKRGKNYLTDLAWATGGRAIEIKDIAKIKKEDLIIIPRVFMPAYYLDFAAADTANKNDHHSLTIRVNRPNLVVQARGGFIQPNDLPPTPDK